VKGKKVKFQGGLFDRRAPRHLRCFLLFVALSDDDVLRSVPVFYLSILNNSREKEEEEETLTSASRRHQGEGE
jgi:hypothetical protein